MLDFLGEFSQNNPILFVILTLAILTIATVLIIVIVIKQGREIKVWGIEIGKKGGEEEQNKIDDLSTYIRYVKVLSFNDKSYSKKVERIGKNLVVTNESIWFNVVVFSKKKSKFNWTFRSGGIAEGSYIYPLMKSLFKDNKYVDQVPSILEQKIPEKSNFFVSVFHSYNGLDEGKYDFGIRFYL